MSKSLSVVPNKYLSVKYSGTDSFIVYYRIPKDDDVHIVESYLNHIAEMNLEILNEEKNKKVSFFCTLDCYELELVDEDEVPSQKMIKSLKFFIPVVKVSCDLSPQDILDMEIFVSCKICNAIPDTKEYTEDYWPFEEWCHGPQHIRFSCNRHETQIK